MLREHYRRRARLALVPEDVAAAEAAAVVQLRDTSPEGLVPAPSAAPRRRTSRRPRAWWRQHRS